MDIDSPENMMRHIRFLKNEVERLKKNLRSAALQRQFLNPRTQLMFYKTLPMVVESKISSMEPKLCSVKAFSRFTGATAYIPVFYYYCFIILPVFLSYSCWPLDGGG